MRLFVGLPVPSSVASRLLDLGHRAALPELRWTAPEELHLTLYFLGEVPESGIPVLSTALNHLHPAPLEIAIASLGIFSRAGVFFAEAEPAPALLRLQALAADTVAAFAARPDPNSPPVGRYHPHITLARTRSGLHADPAELPRPESPIHFRVDRLHLYRSAGSPTGSRYDAIHTVTCAAPPSTPAPATSAQAPGTSAPPESSN